MNLDELQSVRDRERQTDKLQQLRESFYADAGEFIGQLRRERERAAEEAGDPFDSPRVNQLTDEISTAEQMVEAIYEKRIGKIVKAATFDAAGLPAEADGMTAEEQDLFDRLVADIEQNRDRVLAVIDGREDEDVDSQAVGTSSVRDDEESVPAASVMGGGAGDDSDPAGPVTGDDNSRSEDSRPETAPDEPAPPGDAGTDTTTSDESAETAERAVPPDRPPADANPDEDADTSDPDDEGTDGLPDTDHDPQSTSGTPADAASRDGPESEGTTPEPADGPDDIDQAENEDDVERKTIMVTESVDSFVGFDDRDYDLQENDVVTLPVANADILLDQDVAKELE